MDLKDLDADERMVLVGALQFTLQADGTVSPQEVSSMDRLVSSLGREAYQEARDRAQEEMADLRSFDEQVGAIRRPDARDLIYRTLHELAAVDGVVAQEAQILDRLGRAWDIGE